MINLSIKGIGIDIEDIHRFEKKPFGSNKSFFQKLFTPKEIAYCMTKKNPSPHFAVRFCAKEAFIKALPHKETNYQSIEVVFHGDKPSLVYNDVQYQVSLSHDQDKAVAIVIIPA